MSKSTILRPESPADLFDSSLKGDGSAQQRLLDTDLANTRIVVKTQGKIRKAMSREALSNYRSSGEQAAKPFGYTPREIWGAEPERCVVTGEALIGGKSLGAVIDYGGVPKEKRIDARVMINADVLGSDEDTQAEHVEDFFAGEIDGRRWAKRLAVLGRATSAERARARAFVEHGSIGVAWAPPSSPAPVSVGGDVTGPIAVGPGSIAIGGDIHLESAAHKLWSEKRQYLEAELAVATDPQQKFSLRKGIAEAAAHLAWKTK